jgi:hypothetical protein
MSEQEPLSTRDLRTLATLVREMQGDLRALGIKLDLLARGRERDLATFGTRDDMHDIVELLAEKLADAERRVTEAVAQVAESMAGRDRTLAEQSAMLIEILNRLPRRP